MASSDPPRPSTPSTSETLTSCCHDLESTRDCHVPHEKSSVTTQYLGYGTSNSPYIVDWSPNDPENPYNWSKTKKWAITIQLALSTWTVSFGSSCYAGGIQGTMRDFTISEDAAILGVSLYVLGFAFGNLFGRRIVFLLTLSAYALVQLGGSLGQSFPLLLSFRLLAGVFGSSPLTNAGGAVADIWDTRERGLASAIYATVPFLGPVVGPIVGGFVAQNPRLGWRFNFWLIFAFSVLTLALGYLITPETYGPVLLRRRAAKLYAASNGALHYASLYDAGLSRPFYRVLSMNLSRPFLFIIREPIVLLLAIYISVVYGTLYALFSAFFIVFQRHRGFTPGEGGLAFLGIGCGILAGIATQGYQDKLYQKAVYSSATGKAPPEARLYAAMLGAALVPIGLFWFAWTTSPSFHWAISVLAGVPFGAGVAMILQSFTAYLMDTYSLYFASSFAATIVLRSICGAIFPIFAPFVFEKLGDKWAMSIFAFAALVCAPIPVLFWIYGPWIRNKSRVACKDEETRTT